MSTSGFPVHRNGHAYIHTYIQHLTRVLTHVIHTHMMEGPRSLSFPQIHGKNMILKTGINQSRPWLTSRSYWTGRIPKQTLGLSSAQLCLPSPRCGQWVEESNRPSDWTTCPAAHHSPAVPSLWVLCS